MNKIYYQVISNPVGSYEIHYKRTTDREEAFRDFNEKRLKKWSTSLDGYEEVENLSEEEQFFQYFQDGNHDYLEVTIEDEENNIIDSWREYDIDDKNLYSEEYLKGGK